MDRSSDNVDEIRSRKRENERRLTEKFSSCVDMSNQDIEWGMDGDPNLTQSIGAGDIQAIMAMLKKQARAEVEQEMNQDQYTVSATKHPGELVGVGLRTKDLEGMRVLKISETSIFAGTRLRTGDRILSINNIPTDGMDATMGAHILESIEGKITLEVQSARAAQEEVWRQSVATSPRSARVNTFSAPVAKAEPVPDQPVRQPAAPPPLEFRPMGSTMANNHAVEVEPSCCCGPSEAPARSRLQEARLRAAEATGTTHEAQMRAAVKEAERNLEDVRREKCNARLRVFGGIGACILIVFIIGRVLDNAAEDDDDDNYKI